MDIKSSLLIEESEPGSIKLILSGSFAKAYNQSFYLLTEVLKRPLKANAGYIKRADNRFVVSGGFPIYKVAHNYPQALKTEWGYKIIGEYDLSGYGEWLLRHETAANAVVNDATAVGPPSARVRAQCGPTPTLIQSLSQLSRYNSLLTEAQIMYLLNWQKGAYPIEVDLGFIESLKNKVISLT